MSVQGHHCELKLCNLITCIGGKTGGWEKTGPLGAAPVTAKNRAWRTNDHESIVFVIDGFYPSNAGDDDGWLFDISG